MLIRVKVSFVDCPKELQGSYSFIRPVFSQVIYDPFCSLVGLAFLGRGGSNLCIGDGSEYDRDGCVRE